MIETKQDKIMSNKVKLSKIRINNTFKKNEKNALTI